MPGHWAVSYFTVQELKHLSSLVSRQVLTIELHSNLSSLLSRQVLTTELHSNLSSLLSKMEHFGTGEMAQRLTS